MPRAPTYNPRLTTVLLHLFRMIVPGVGQVAQDRHLSALVYFFMFVFFINGMFIGRAVLSRADPQTVRHACAGLAGLVWLISAYDYLRVEGRRRREPPKADDNG